MIRLAISAVNVDDVDVSSQHCIIEQKHEEAEVVDLVTVQIPVVVNQCLHTVGVKDTKLRLAVLGDGLHDLTLEIVLFSDAHHRQKVDLVADIMQRLVFRTGEQVLSTHIVRE